MGKERRRYSKEFKAQVAIEALKEQKTLARLSVEYSIHPNQISLWENELVGKIPKIFDTGHGKIDPSVVEDIKAPLYEEIGRLKVENDFLKKKSIFAQIRRDLP